MHITIYQTARGEDSFINCLYSGLPDNTQNRKIIIIDPDIRMQELLGFGGAFTESAAFVYSKLSPEKQKQVMDAYFHPDAGIGYTLGRIAITSCDFSFGNFTYVKDNDGTPGSFSIEHDNTWLLPMMSAAKETLGKDLTLFAAPWSPPAWMKSNNDMLHGGYLLPQYYGAWALYFLKTIKAYNDIGFPIFAVSVQNEPEAVQLWESCIYTAEQERDFIKRHLGPALKRSGLDTNITIWDHNRDRMAKRAEGVLGDAEAARYVWGTAFHWYTEGGHENVAHVHEQFPEKHLVFTEGCIEKGPRPGSWETGERYGRNIINDLNSWNEGFIDWNLLLDETGGPNHTGNFCDAPVLADTHTDTLTFNSSFYYIAHFSKFIKPGARRIACEGIEGVYSTAFVNPDGSVAAVMQNEEGAAVRCCLQLKRITQSIELKAHSITTVIFR